MLKGKEIAFKIPCSSLSLTLVLSKLKLRTPLTQLNPLDGYCSMFNDFFTSGDSTVDWETIECLGLTASISCARYKTCIM